MASTSRVDEFVERLKQAAGTNLQSIVLYGSAASGEFDSDISDVNLLCILHDSSFGSLEQLVPAIKWWTRRQHTVPLLMTREELERSADVFSIEFMDMRGQYRILFGADVLKELAIPMALHRVQVEYEIREKLLLLRQRVLLASGNSRQLRTLLLESLPSFLTLFRHALIALGQDPAVDKREAVQRLARHVGFDPAAIERVMDARARTKDLNTSEVNSVFAGYLKAVEQVAAAVDRMLDQGKSVQPTA